VNFSLTGILNTADLSRYPSIQAVLGQRWLYSHYIHGQVAWEHGLRCGKDEAQSFQVGMALELGWAAVLLLDDILDEDEMRFHAVAAWKTNGIGATAMEAGSLLVKSTAILNDWPSILESFAHAVEETEVASRELRKIDYGAKMSVLEPLVSSLGAMSVFATSWAIPESGIGKVATYETCAGQLVNDCNDCFGAKARRRNYPDLRTHQPTLLSQLLITADKTGKWYELFENAAKNDLPQLSLHIQKEIRKDSAPIFAYFDLCMARAKNALSEIKDIPEQEYIGARNRVSSNAKAWKAKIERLIST